MFRKTVFYDNFTDALTSTWWMYFLQGVLLVLLGLLIFIEPDLIAYFVATVFVVVGVLFLTLAWRTRRLKRDYRRWREAFWEPFE